MTDQLISFETAKLAKEKGFDIPVLYAFDDDNGEILSSYSSSVFSPLNYNSSGHKHSRPTQSLLQRWLREQHKLYVHMFSIVTREGVILWACDVYDHTKTDPEDEDYVAYEWQRELAMFKTDYESALEQGLQEALKLIK